MLNSLCVIHLQQHELHDGDMEVIPYIFLRLCVLGVVLREDRTFHQNFTLFGQRNVTQVNSLSRCDFFLGFLLIFCGAIAGSGLLKSPFQCFAGRCISKRQRRAPSTHRCRLTPSTLSTKLLLQALIFRVVSHLSC